MGAWIRANDECNVPIPPNSCAEIGSALTFELVVHLNGENRHIYPRTRSPHFKGVAVYTPFDYPLLFNPRGTRFSLMTAFRICARGRENSWDGELDLTFFSECIAANVPGARLVLTLWHTYWVDHEPMGEVIEFKREIHFTSGSRGMVTLILQV